MKALLLIASLTIQVGDGKGPLTMQLRDVELRHVFFVLHDLTGEAFFVAPDVHGTVSIDAKGATLEQILARLPVKVSAGPMRHVTNGPPKLPEEQNWQGEKITVQVQDADMADYLCLFHDITSLEIELANNARVKPSVYAQDVPWDRILANLVASAGLTYKIEDDPPKLVVGPEPARDACVIVSEPPFGVIPPKPEEMKASDLEIAGLARVGDQWKAYAFGWGRLHILEKGTPLAGAKVEAVRANGVVINGAFKPLRAEEESTSRPKASDR